MYLLGEDQSSSHRGWKATTSLRCLPLPVRGGAGYREKRCDLGLTFWSGATAEGEEVLWVFFGNRYEGGPLFHVSISITIAIVLVWFTHSLMRGILTLAIFPSALLWCSLNHGCRSFDIDVSIGSGITRMCWSLLCVQLWFSVLVSI